MLPTIRKIRIMFERQLTKIRLAFRKDTVSLDPPPSGMDKKTILKKIDKVPVWWHCIDLGYGIVTQGREGGITHPTGTKNLLKNIQLPDDLRGKTVLDIGAWDGFFSFEAEKRGALKVLAIDNFYRNTLDYTGTQGFEVAKEILKSNVEFKKASVYDLSPEKFGMFDIVLFLGVFYHLKNPLLGLEKIFSVTKDVLIMETHYDPYDGDKKTPLARFYENAEINNDPTTWWGFNEACLLAALRTVGFINPKVIYRYADRIILKAYKPR